MAAITTAIEKKMTLSLWLVIALVASIVVLATCDPQDGELFNNNNVNNIKTNKQYQMSEVEKRPFFVGSRYGRSQQSYDSNNGLHGGLHVVPRNDRFFLGSRYGKRSQEIPDQSLQNAATADGTALSCLYTGIGNIYRCYGKETYTKDDHYSSNDISAK